MKKVAAILVVGLLAQGTAFAAARGTAEYEQLKAYKKMKREQKANGPIEAAPKEKGFWQREAERSGFAGTGAMLTNTVTSVLPFDKLNSGKEQK